MPAVAVAEAPQPFSLDPNISLGANLERLVSIKLRRGLHAGETASLKGALEEGLSILQAGRAEAQQQLLTANATKALVSAAGAQLWACCLKAAEAEEVVSADLLATAITANCSDIAGELFAAALGM